MGFFSVGFSDNCRKSSLWQKDLRSWDTKPIFGVDRCLAADERPVALLRLVCPAPLCLFRPCWHLPCWIGRLSVKGRRPKKSLWLAVHLSESVHEKRNGSEGPKQTIKKANLGFNLTPAPDTGSGKPHELLAVEWTWNARYLLFVYITQSVLLLSVYHAVCVRLLPLLNDEYTLPPPAGKERYCHSRMRSAYVLLGRRLKSLRCVPV